MTTTKKKAAKKTARKTGLRTSATARGAGAAATARAGKTKAKAKVKKESADPATKRRKAGLAATSPDRAAAPPTGSPSSRRLKEARGAAEAAIEAALDKKALVPVLLDVSGEATYTDFIGIVSGRSDRQVDAIAENVTLTMKQRGWQLLGREGTGNGRWTLLDFGDFVLHVFYHPVREFYDIEGLWIEAPRLKLKVPPEAMHVQADALYDTA